jgi:hypothetical protein
MLQLFCIYSFRYMKCYFPCYMFCTLPSAVCVQCPVWMCFVVLDFFCSSGILWLICGWFHLPSIWLVSLMFLHSTCTIFLLQGLKLTIPASYCITFLSPEIATSANIIVPFFITMDHDVRFAVRDGSVGLHLLIP